ncbi:MAG: amidohydrolase/deacetylase family metallohydrolase [Candidatus Rokubacteria bacterium]|nr:amidohydrolase/deacetylase family metallohydrolase [Candidatus Rokubacteria bacterium]
MLIQGGTVVDPGQGPAAVRDVRLADGRVTALGENLRPEPREEVIDARGLLVTPGLIDLHVHVYYGASHYGIEPDPHCLATGTTTVVDAGSAGALTFTAFRKYVIEVAETRILPLLNISATGMLSAEIGELEDVRFIDRAKALQTIEANRDLIHGVKVRLSRQQAGANARVALTTALETAAAARLPLMVHVGDTPIPLDDILRELRPGDVMTHCFHGREQGVLDERGRVRDGARRAVSRGVVFDVGHGVGSFAFAVARAALAQDLRPGTISSDLHVYNVHGPVFDLATTMTKFLALGLGLDEVVRMVTEAPAKVIGAAGRLGTLSPGTAADVTMLRLERGSFELTDARGETMTHGERLVPVRVVRNSVARAASLQPARPPGVAVTRAGHPMR